MERLVAQLHIDGAKARQPGLEAESARLGGRRYRAFIIFYIIGQLIPFENYFVTLFVEAPSTHDKYRETDIDFQTVFVFKTGTALTKKNDNVQTRNMITRSPNPDVNRGSVSRPCASISGSPGTV